MIALNLSVTLKAKIHVGLDQHLLGHRAMDLVAGCASLAERFVLKHMGPHLLLVAFAACVINSRDGQFAGL